MPRFVILEHTGSATYKPGRHWDLMLESENRLRTWELQQIPSAGIAVSAKALPDHRPDYLEYEGVLTDNRGSVTRWDSGDYSIVTETALEVVVQLNGREIRGRLYFTRGEAENGVWRAIFHGS